MVNEMNRAVLNEFIRVYLVFFTKELPFLESEFKNYYGIATSEWFAIKKDMTQDFIRSSQKIFQLLDDLFEKAEMFYYQLIGSISTDASYAKLKNYPDIQSRWNEIQRLAKAVLAAL